MHGRRVSPRTEARNASFAATERRIYENVAPGICS